MVAYVNQSNNKNVEAKDNSYEGGCSIVV
jgi:hypothetical protein